MEQAQDSTYRVTFYYCVHSRSDAVQYREFEYLARQQVNLQPVLLCTEERGHLRAADISGLDDKDIFMCGPKGFTADLQRQFVQLGVAGDRIHFEDFEFREGLIRPAGTFERKPILRDTPLAHTHQVGGIITQS